ncbi:hypothetical protein EXIGLDRAFT_847230 [Exidia glandulosa HHB12029]|uniref:Uncharacterized protein n=1 Tax=Exidia glandulosa HHB12029 TaxID=1314781 RepID=A0A166N3J4_EXIGL|nr:hypothetical protein EXIGLDRAFT_847230 [Exidia glandulosa HHB12029]
MTGPALPQGGGKIRGVAKEVVVISPERRDRSYAAQLASGAGIVALGDDVTRMVFELLPFSSCIASSHVCAYWRALAVSDPLLWTVLDGDPALIPVLWARAGPDTAIDVCLDSGESSLEDVVSCISNNLQRMTGLRVLVPNTDVQPAEWTNVLNTLSRPAPRMRQLHLAAPSTEPYMSCSLARLGPMRHLQELALLRTDGLDFTLLPATLTSFARYCGPAAV